MSIKKILVLFALTSLVGCTASLNVERETAESDRDPWPFATWENCSSSLDSHPCNFTLNNHESEPISLYDYYGSDIVIDLSAMWCGPCGIAASEVSDIKSIYPDVKYITVLIDNEYGEPPSSEDLRRWVDTFQIQEPVLGGDRSIISGGDESWPIEGWPTFYYINKEMLVEHTHPGYSQNLIIQNIRILTQ